MILHNILGFYASFLALIIAITGVFYSFFFVQAMMYYLFSGGETTYPNYSKYKTTSPKEWRTEQTLYKIARQVETAYPEAFGYSLDFGHEHLDDHEHPYFSVFIKHYSYSYHKNHEIIFDENTGELKKIIDHKDKNFGQKVVAANYDIHVGQFAVLAQRF